jgi:hypothetical protein
MRILVHHVIRRAAHRNGYKVVDRFANGHGLWHFNKTSHWLAKPHAFVGIRSHGAHVV